MKNITFAILVSILLTACSNEKVVERTVSVPNPCGNADASTPPPAPTCSRPAGNTGHGLYVSGNKICDANNVPIVLRGPNSFREVDPSTWSVATPAMHNNKANVVRIDNYNPLASNAPTRKILVETAIANKLIAITGIFGDGITCGTDTNTLLNNVNTIWTGSDLAYIKSNERNIIVNIANEWGNPDSSWRDAYITAVQKIRNAGYTGLLMIDTGGGCGQFYTTVVSYGKAVLDADPQHNIVFDIHWYGFYVDPGSPTAGTWDGVQPYDLGIALNKLDATNLAYTIGEVGNGPSWVTYTPAKAIAAIESHNVSWLPWAYSNGVYELSLVNPMDNAGATGSSPWTTFGTLVIPYWQKNNIATTF